MKTSRKLTGSVLPLICALLVTPLVPRATAQSNAWTQLFPTGGPPATRAGHTAVLNTSNGRMIVFGGALGTVSGPAGELNDVWIFQDARTNVGNTWQQLTVNGTLPGPRWEQTAVYDQANNRMIIFGGDADGGYCFGALNDVWVLSNADGTGGTAVWTQLSPAGTPPPNRASASAVYDPASNRMIIYGGNQVCDGPYSDLWVLTNANGLGGTPGWIQLIPAGGGPGPRNSQTAFYDTTNNQMILFGGRLPSGYPTNDIWSLSNANGLGGMPTWTLLNPLGPLPAPRFNFGAAYDPVLNTLAIFGGSTAAGYTNDAWVLSNANGLGGAPDWIQLIPGGLLPVGRQYCSCVGIPGADRIVVCDGINNSGTINDVWVLQYSIQAPTLGIASAGNQAVLIWPASDANYVVQTTTNLFSPNWVTVTNGNPIIGITLTNSLPGAFFRLIQQ